MNSKLLKRILILFVLILAIMGMFATTRADISFELYRPMTTERETDFAVTTLKVNYILTIIRVAGIIITVVALIILGVKYIFGSVEEKAEYKKTMIPYLIGFVFILATSVFAQTMHDTFTDYMFTGTKPVVDSTGGEVSEWDRVHDARITDGDASNLPPEGQSGV